MAWQATSGQNYSSVHTLHIQLKWLWMRKLMPLPKIFKVLTSYLCHRLEKRLEGKKNLQWLYTGLLFLECGTAFLEPERVFWF